MIYTQLKEKYAAELAKTIGTFNLISVFRLGLVVFFLLAVYFYTSTVSALWLISGLAAALIFAVLIYFHEKIKHKRDLLAALLKINKDFENGKEFSPENQPYAYDIDIFGDYSLYQHLCRCGTYPGKKRLSEVLLNRLSDEEILENQKAAAELKDKLEFRQKLLAVASMKKDSKKLYEDILKWIEIPNPAYSPVLRILSYLTPAVLFVLITAYFITWNIQLTNFITYVFLLNLGILYTQLKKIQQQILNADRVK